MRPFTCGTMKTKPRKNCYEILGVSTQANDEQVRQAYYLLALHYHPDRHPGNDKAKQHFVAVNHAYNMLKTKPQRQAYNRLLARADKTDQVASRSKTVAAARQPRQIMGFLLVLREVFWPFALKVQQEASSRG